MIMEPLIPIFCIIMLGFAVSRTPVSSRSVWEGLERLTYYLFFPALLISRLSATRFEAAKLLDIGLALRLARQLCGDVSLMANIINLQTVVAFFTIPVWLNVGNRLLW